MKIKRAGLYVRVSTEDQRTDLQERQLTEYVERRGWKLHKTYGTRYPEPPCRGLDWMSY
jgi:DNA invertase Pin-like site-specific DNA recombinase